MAGIVSQIIFTGLAATAIGLFVKRASQIRKNILLGKDDVDRTDPAQRRTNMLRVAFGQQKMFARPIPAFLHLFVYVGFLLVNVELLEIILDGILGTHRLFQPFLGGFYNVLINFFEFLAVLVLLSCVAFMMRRNMVKIDRFHKPEMQKWPTLDANLILVFEIVLMFFLLNMNATDTVIQQKNGNATEGFFFSNMFVSFYQNASLESVVLAERFYWWAHIIGIFVFANYVLLSKHLHIFLAFPATYFANLSVKGKIQNMPAVTQEVKSMLGIPVTEAAPVGELKFGAKDVGDLSWKHILNAYTCTECGRCTSSCPANITGKELSPRKVMMDVRDRADELGYYKAKNGADSHDGKSLLGDFIKDEEINACTTCNACTEACPINLNPLEIIIEARRFRAMEESKGPSEWIGIYQNMETNFSPWKMPVQDRFKWAEDVKGD